MMLNVYKLSGVGAGEKEASERSKYRYYTNRTVECNNTIAYNYLLSQLNAIVMEVNICTDESDIINGLNSLDIIALSIEALNLHSERSSEFTLDFLGTVIAEMIADGCFESTVLEDDARGNNLDKIYAEFVERISSPLTGKTDADFVEWWNENVLSKNYNGLSEEEVERYNEYITNVDQEKVEGDSKEPKTMADYIMDAAPAFLYLFIPDENEREYNSTIRWRRKIETDKNFEFLVKNVGGMYDIDTIILMLRAGIIKEYGMTPEQKNAEILANGGKVGIATEAIIAIVGMVISFLVALFNIVIKIFEVKYTKPDGYEDGVPDSETDLNAAFQADREEEAEKKNKKNIGMIAAATAIGLFILNK